MKKKDFQWTPGSDIKISPGPKQDVKNKGLACGFNKIGYLLHYVALFGYLPSLRNNK